MVQRPVALTALGALQFAAFAAGCVFVLGEGTVDGALTAADVVLAVGVALGGAVVVGSTWSGGRVAWWFELLLGIAVLAWGGLVGVADEDTIGYGLIGVGLIWVAIVALPQSRAWFLRPVQ